MTVGLLLEGIGNLEQLFGFGPQLRGFLELLASRLLVDLSHRRGLLCAHKWSLRSVYKPRSRKSNFLAKPELGRQRTGAFACNFYGLATPPLIVVVGGNSPANGFAREHMSKTATRRVKAGTPGKARRGRPRVHREAWAKVSVVLFERQVKRLDRLTREVRRKSGRAMTRAEIIRALIDGLILSGIELTDHGSEAALRSHIAGRLTRGGGDRGRVS